MLIMYNEHVTEIRTCKHHGESEYTKDPSGSWRCKRCRVDAVRKRRNKLKLLAVEYKGGKCKRCGYNKCTRALEFHHLDPNEKDFGITAKGFTRSWEKTKIELDKCIMLCANCHAEEHDGVYPIGKGADC
jgi:hypothetical protein